MAELLAVCSEEPEEATRRIWNLVAACARYGRQRVPDLLDMSYNDAIAFKRALNDLMEAEARASEGTMGLLGPEHGD